MQAKGAQAVGAAEPAVPPRVVGAVALLAGAVVLAVVAAALPPAALAIAVVAAVLAAVWRLPVGTALLVVLAAAAWIGGAVGASAWPATTALVAVVGGIVVLAVFRPSYALAAGVLLIGFEGSIKILLGLDPTPLGDERTAGAGAIDLVLFSAVGATLVADRLRTPRLLWSRASRAERIVLGLLGAWFVLSVLQVAQGGDPARGAEGFRLFQAYVALAAAAAIAVAPRAIPARTVTVALLAIGGAVALYAAVRVTIGPAAAETRFALSVETTTAYGSAVRAVGSFSSAVGLGSYLTPVAVFALVAGSLGRGRLRIGAWTVATLALVGVLGSYGRGPVMAIAAGVLFAVLVVFAASAVPRRTKWVALAAAVGALGLTAGGLAVASGASPELRERAQGLLNPFADESMQLRFDTWDRSVRRIADAPLGRGLGAVGAASAEDRRRILTTDSTYLKVLIEQGIPVAALLFAGLLGTVAFAARRLARADPASRALGLPALAGFVAFLVLAALGEYVEQPGKVIAWSMLGIAVAHALTARAAHERTGATT